MTLPTKLPSLGEEGGTERGGGRRKGGERGGEKQRLPLSPDTLQPSPHPATPPTRETDENDATPNCPPPARETLHACQRQMPANLPTRQTDQDGVSTMESLPLSRNAMC